jgi:hypothetical protein
MAPKKPKKKKAVKAAKQTAKKAAPRAIVAAPAADEDIEASVLAIVAQLCGVPSAEVGGKPLSKLTASCDDKFRVRVAGQLDAKWSALNPPFISDDIACSYTVDTLTHAVTIRLG